MIYHINFREFCIIRLDSSEYYNYAHNGMWFAAMKRLDNERGRIFMDTNI